LTWLAAGQGLLAIARPTEEGRVRAHSIFR
jgi:hypothetical protein